MGTLPGPADRPRLRVSDADREQAAETLRRAAGDGRITFTELDRAGGPGTPGAPRVRVTGFALMGGVDVRRKPATAPLEGPGGDSPSVPDQQRRGIEGEPGRP